MLGLFLIFVGIVAWIISTIESNKRSIDNQNRAKQNGDDLYFDDNNILRSTKFGGIGHYDRDSKNGHKLLIEKNLFGNVESIRDLYQERLNEQIEKWKQEAEKNNSTVYQFSFTGERSENKIKKIWKNREYVKQYPNAVHIVTDFLYADYIGRLYHDINSDDIYVKRRIPMDGKEFERYSPIFFEVYLSVKSGQFVRFTDEQIMSYSDEINAAFGSIDDSKKWFDELNEQQRLYYVKHGKHNPNNDRLVRYGDD